MEAAVANFDLNDMASACLGASHRRAGRYAVEWGLGLQEVLLDRTQMHHVVPTKRMASALPPPLVRHCQQALDLHWAAARAPGSATLLGLDAVVLRLRAALRMREAEGMVRKWWAETESK